MSASFKLLLAAGDRSMEVRSIIPEAHHIDLMAGNMHARSDQGMAVFDDIHGKEMAYY